MVKKFHLWHFFSNFKFKFVPASYSLDNSVGKAYISDARWMWIDPSHCWSSLFITIKRTSIVYFLNLTESWSPTQNAMWGNKVALIKVFWILICFNLLFFFFSFVFKEVGNDCSWPDCYFCEACFDNLKSFGHQGPLTSE